MKQLLISCGVLLLMAGFTLSGCEKTPDGGILNTNMLSKFSGEGGSQDLTIFSSYDWSATSSASWCKISSKSGSGGRSVIRVTVDPGAYSPRTATITISSNGQQEIVTVTQKRYLIATVSIPATDGFWMGTGATPEEHNYPGYSRPNTLEYEYPVHQVKLSAFRMGITEVTNAQYATFLNAADNIEFKNGRACDKDGTLLLYCCWSGRSPWGITYLSERWIPVPGYENHPVIYVTWPGAVAFCTWLSEETGQTWRLPTEAEWEYACRGKSDTPAKAWEGRWCFGSDEKELNKYAWFGGADGNSDGTTHAVGQKKPNSYGLYDMHGNVREWCSDWLKRTYYEDTPVGGWENPTGPATGTERVVRGGDWRRSYTETRSAYRNLGIATTVDNFIGFRVVLVP